MTKHNKNWRQTYSGRRVVPVDVQPEDVDIVDIAHHLAFQNRYGGSLHGYESVAEHCVLMARHVIEEYHDLTPLHGLRYTDGTWDMSWIRVAKHALLHDAAEAYLQDQCRPLKLELWIKDPRDPEKFVTYKEIEHRTERIINVKFGLCPADPPIIDELDNRITRNEYMQGMLYDPGWLITRKAISENDEALPLKIEFWTPERAEKEYLFMYNKLWSME